MFIFFFSWWQTVWMFLKMLELLIALRTSLDKFKCVTWCVLILFWFCNLVSTLHCVARFVVTADHYLPKVNKTNHKAMFWNIVLKLLSRFLTDLYLMVYFFLLILLLFFMAGVCVLIMISSFIFWCILLRPWVDGDEILEKTIKV